MEDLESLSDYQLDQKIVSLEEQEEIADGTEYGMEITYRLQQVKTEVARRAKLAEELDDGGLIASYL